MKWSIICWLEVCKTLKDERFRGLSPEVLLPGLLLLLLLLLLANVAFEVESLGSEEKNESIIMIETTHFLSFFIAYLWIINWNDLC